MRFAIVTLCFMLLSVGAWANTMNPLKHLGFNFGDSQSKIEQALSVDKELNAGDLHWVNDHRAVTIINYWWDDHPAGFTVAFSNNNRLTAVVISLGGSFNDWCSDVEYEYHKKPDRIAPGTIAVYNIRKGLTIIVYAKTSSGVDIYFLPNDEGIPF